MNRNVIFNARKSIENDLMGGEMAVLRFGRK